MANTKDNCSSFNSKIAYVPEIAYLFYNDGIQTVIAISGTYAILELKLEQLSLVFAIVIVQITALIGAL